jgi:hypothetical protein
VTATPEPWRRYHKEASIPPTNLAEAVSADYEIVQSTKQAPFRIESMSMTSNLTCGIWPSLPAYLPENQTFRDVKIALESYKEVSNISDHEVE